MPFEIREEDGVWLLVLKSRVGLDDHTWIKEGVTRALDKSTRKFLIDLADLDLVTTPFLGLLVSLQKQTAQKGGRLLLSGLSPYAKEIFDLTRLSKIFEICKDRDSAKAAFQG